MFCPKCGNELADNASFCAKCGAEISSDNTSVSEAAKGDSPQPSLRQGQSTGFGFQSQTSSKPKLKPEQVAASVYISAAVPIVLGVVLFLFGQYLVSQYSGFSWYEPYTQKAGMGTLFEIIGALCCLVGAFRLAQFFMKKK